MIITRNSYPYMILRDRQAERASSRSLLPPRMHAILAPPVPPAGGAFLPEQRKNRMPLDLDLIANTPDMRCLPAAQARIAISTRIAVVFTKLRRDPRAELANRLGSGKAAARFLGFIEVMGAAWPDPVYVNAPCCPKLSYDEMMVLDLMTACGSADRAAFDALLCDMLPVDVRDRIYTAAGSFIAAYSRRTA